MVYDSNAKPQGIIPTILGDQYNNFILQELLGVLSDTLYTIWSESTTEGPEKFGNIGTDSSWRQDTATALVVRHLFGGIIRSTHIGAGIAYEHHYNILPDGTIVDLAAKQHAAHLIKQPGGVVDTQTLLQDPEVTRRFTTLLAAVENHGLGTHEIRKISHDI